MQAPFYTFKKALEERYGERVYKLTISGGRTCPTRDGTFGPKKGWGGCSFCDIHGSASYFSHGRRELPVRLQLEAAAGPVSKKFKANKFLAYFQSYTTTHEEIAEFAERWQEALKVGQKFIGFKFFTHRSSGSF
jgi:radical SAM superfamily enzyme